MPDSPAPQRRVKDVMGFERALLPAVMLAGCAMGVAATAAVPGGPASASRGVLQMLDQLQDGRWELRVRGDGSVQQLCIGDRRRLVQLRHADLACERLIVEDTAQSVIVQYTCRGHGYGRTHIRRETGQLIQVETQGVADGLPFDYAAEGRRIGDCGA